MRVLNRYAKVGQERLGHSTIVMTLLLLTGIGCAIIAVFCHHGRRDRLELAVLRRRPVLRTTVPAFLAAGRRHPSALKLLMIIATRGAIISSIIANTAASRMTAVSAGSLPADQGVRWRPRGGLNHARAPDPISQGFPLSTTWPATRLLLCFPLVERTSRSASLSFFFAQVPLSPFTTNGIVRDAWPIRFARLDWSARQRPPQP